MHFSPVDIEEEVKTRGYTTDILDFREIRGCVIQSQEEYHIFLSSNLDPIKKRMCVAHELAHIEDDSIDSVHVFLAERRACQMARKKLVPCEALRELIADGFTDYSTLASLFGVSPKMIMLRCQDLSIF